MTELVDASLKCTTNFAKEPIYNDVIRDMESIRLFKNILLHFAGDNKGPTETLLRLTIMIIEIIASSDLDGAFIIHQENIEQDVIRLANHSNQKIGMYLNQWKTLNHAHLFSQIKCTFHFMFISYFLASSASGILHALNNMRHQEQTGNFHPSRNVQQSQHTQMQVCTNLKDNLCHYICFYFTFLQNDEIITF